MCIRDRYMAVLLPLAAQPPKHEVRAAWITAVYGLDLSLIHIYNKAASSAIGVIQINPASHQLHYLIGYGKPQSGPFGKRVHLIKTDVYKRQHLGRRV